MTLQRELIRRAQETGFDGMIEFCVDGEPMNDIVVASCRRENIAVERIYSVRYLSRLLFPKADWPSRENDAGIVDAFLELSSAIVPQIPLARVWTRAEAEWQCISRSGAIAVRHFCNSRQGILTGYIVDVSNRNRDKCLMIEDLLWHDLNVIERKTLLQRLMSAARAAGAKMVAAPVMGYADIEPLEASQFRASSRKLNAYLSIWNGSPPVRVSSMYVDVF